MDCASTLNCELDAIQIGEASSTQNNLGGFGFCLI